jgi:hypothetical protein
MNEQHASEVVSGITPKPTKQLRLIVHLGLKSVCYFQNSLKS